MVIYMGIYKYTTGPAGNDRGTEQVKSGKTKGPIYVSLSGPKSCLHDKLSRENDIGRWMDAHDRNRAI